MDYYPIYSSELEPVFFNVGYKTGEQIRHKSTMAIFKQPYSFLQDI
jgi:hypothetical protein